MNKSYLLLLLLLGFLSSCKTEFEKLRTSNQPEQIYAAANKYYDAKDYQKAIALYDIVIQHYRGRKEAEDLFFKYAYAHYHSGDYILSGSYFKNYSTTFTSSSNKEEADFMANYSNYKLSPNYKLDQTYTQKAIDGFETFVNFYPNSTRINTVNKLIDELRVKLEKKSVEQGHLYYKMGKFQSAITSFQITLKEFPDYKNSEELRYLIVKSAAIQAENSIYEKKEERFIEAISYCEIFEKKHPKSKNIKEVRLIKKDAENQLKKLRA